MDSHKKSDINDRLAVKKIAVCIKAENHLFIETRNVQIANNTCKNKLILQMTLLSCYLPPLDKFNYMTILFIHANELCVKNYHWHGTLNLYDLSPSCS